MIELLMLIAWMLPALAVYRRVGYAIEPKIKAGGSGIGDHTVGCYACNCTNCGQSYANHVRWRSISAGVCNDWTANRLPHPRTLLAFPLVVAFWPLIMAIFAAATVNKKLELTSDTFFTPPPVIETKAEKQARIMAERELEATKREADILKREKELGLV